MTLPELMVSVVIVGVLSSAAITTYKEQVATAHSAEAVAMLGDLQRSTERSVVEGGQNDGALNLQVNTFGSPKSFGKGNGNGNSNKVNKDAELDNDGNNGHGNNEGKCDPSNPGNSKDCDGETSADDSSSSKGNGNGKSDKANKDAELDNDGNNGHGNNEGKCDPSNPGNSKACDGETSADDSSNGNGNGNGNSDKANKDAELDNDGNNGHGNNEGKCDPSNPGNSKDCDGSSGSGTDGSGNDGGGDSSSDGSGDGSGSDADDAGSGSGSGSGTDGGSVGGVFGSGDRLCGSASPVPSSFDKVKGSVYNAPQSEWASGDQSSGWKCLGMSRSGNQRYQYGYDLGAGTVDGASESYTGWARGDLDGDGHSSLFRMRGEVVDGKLIHAPTIEVVDRTE